MTYRKYNFKAICSSDKGVSVIEHDSSVGVVFHPKNGYKETGKLYGYYGSLKYSIELEDGVKYKKIL